MRKTRIPLFIIVAITLSSIPMGLFIINTAADTTITLPDYEPMDIGYKVRASIEHVDPPSLSSMEGMPKSSVISVYQYQVGDIQQWLAYWSGAGYYWDLFELRAMNEIAEIWVQLDMSYPTDDPRNPVEVTDEQVEYMLEEFSGNIIPTDEGYFGEPDELYGDDYWGAGIWADPNGKKVILVENIIDDSYFDPTYPAYVVGVYSPTIEFYHDRNVITIDGYDWVNRIGDDSARPNLYESTVAHEYQHLIHDDHMQPSETFMNEACSLFAEPLCGYELDAGQIEWFLATPDNSLTVWGDQGGINILADYGASFLWALYLTSHYGFDFMGRYVSNGIAGIEGINLLLDDFNTDFLEVFHDWRLANFINAKSGKYSYSSFGFNLDGLNTPLRVYEVDGKCIPWTSAYDEFGETIGGDYNDPPYPTGVYNLAPFGTDYFSFPDLRRLNSFWFDGDDEANVTGWTLDDYFENEGLEWYSGAEDLSNKLIAAKVYVDPADPYLDLLTYWDIEEYWDFGFVQVSTEGTYESEWTSLELEDVTTYDHDPSAHPDVVANLPGITGWSENTQMLTFDLSAYAGDEIYIGFRYVTDWATLEEGWYLIDAEVSGVNIDESLGIIYPEADFMVTIVEVMKVHGHTFYKVRDMKFKCDGTEFGVQMIQSNKWETAFVLVSPTNLNGWVDYEFKVTNFFRRGRCCW